MVWTAVPILRAQTTKPNLRSFSFWKFVSKQQLVQNVALGTEVRIVSEYKRQQKVTEFIDFIGFPLLLFMRVC